MIGQNSKEDVIPLMSKRVSLYIYINGEKIITVEPVEDHSPEKLVLDVSVNILLLISYHTKVFE